MRFVGRPSGWRPTALPDRNDSHSQAGCALEVPGLILTDVQPSGLVQAHQGTGPLSTDPGCSVGDSTASRVAEMLRKRVEMALSFAGWPTLPESTREFSVIQFKLRRDEVASRQPSRLRRGLMPGRLRSCTSGRASRYVPRQLARLVTPSVVDRISNATPVSPSPYLSQSSERH